MTGKNPLIDIAVELEKIALEDDYFVDRKLYPNVDFYSGLIYQAMGFPTDMFPVLFAIGRIPGWLAQWQENLLDPRAGHRPSAPDLRRRRRARLRPDPRALSQPPHTTMAVRAGTGIARPGRLRRRCRERPRRASRRRHPLDRLGHRGATSR